MFSQMESTISLFSQLKLRHERKSHSPVDSLKAWVEAVHAMDPAIGACKTLVLKPSKGPNSNLIFVVSLESTPLSLGALAKSLGYKDARMAQDDVVSATFATEKINLIPFALSNVQDKSTVTVVIDQNILKSQKLAFRAFSGSESLLIPTSSFTSYLETTVSDHKVLDFSNLSAPAAAPEQLKKDNSSTAIGGGNSINASLGTDFFVIEKEVLIGMTVTKEENFPKWYEQVLTRTEMLDYYDVSGCYIIRPYAFAIWKKIQAFFGGEIEELGVEDCYFPMFVTEARLNREKDHIEGFSPEVAWVTRAGKSDLAEPIAVRPTSETVMYPYYASWIRSHRDLPVRLNQWCNVVRWEFKHPQPFLRTREFLWQEGHTAFATLEEAGKEVLEILELYRRVYEDILAVPVVPGKKSEKEKFAGGLYTTTVEGFIPTTGRAIQGATSHCLGQNFSKMFEIMVDGENGERSHVWQNSWGLTTRTIGVMVMVHGDDKGLVLPPKVAQFQVVIVPCGLTVKTKKEEQQRVYGEIEKLAATLKAAGIRAKTDVRENYSPGYKFNAWELRGVPIRLEIGPKDLSKNETRSVIRHNGEVAQLSLDGIDSTISGMLEKIQNDMFLKAKGVRDSRLVRLETWDNFVETLNKKCLVLSPWCEKVSCEEAVKDKSARIAQNDEPADEKAPSMGAKTLCIPFNQPKDGVNESTKCFACGEKAVSYTLWGRSY